ncbi:MAG: 4Fe-4S binding protein, partial [Thermodesulfovibrionia bacterium]|nr:4Fe-4S binding protein [Thermodesulfovibrionia bacterium]
FTAEESCGKCPPCRIGTKIMLDMLSDITEGRGKEGDIDTLEELSRDIIDGSLCGLGQSAPNPVLTTIKYFRDEYESHITDNWCKVGICRKLSTFFINEEVCKGCGACMRACPSKAIVGEKKKPHRIIQEVCVQCKSCFDTCKFKSVIVGPAHYTGDPMALIKK